MLRLFATYTIVEVVEHSQDLELLVNADDWQTCCGSSLADIFLMLTPSLVLLRLNPILKPVLLLLNPIKVRF